MHFRSGIAIVALVLAFVPSALARPTSAIVRVVDLGDGANESWIFLPERAPECAVVFVHDAGDISPARYTPWLETIAGGDHCAVIFPRFQATAAKPAPVADLRRLHVGITASLAYVRRTSGNNGAPLPTVAAGYGYGGTLALSYAAKARSWGFPVPAAVDSVFPIVGAFPSALPERNTRVLIQAGDRDTAGGRKSASDLLHYLSPHARKRLVLVHSTPTFAANHGAPLQVTDESESAFWQPLDALIGAAVG
jgi:hypothetical protein